MDSYDVHVHPIQFQLYNKESFWTFNIIKKEVKTNRTNTNNVNKTRDLLQTTGSKDEPNKHK
jgi:hypothetical protein